MYIEASRESILERFSEGEDLFIRQFVRIYAIFKKRFERRSWIEPWKKNFPRRKSTSFTCVDFAFFAKRELACRGRPWPLAPSIFLHPWPCFQCNGGGHAGKSAPRPLVTVAFKNRDTFSPHRRRFPPAVRRRRRVVSVPRASATRAGTRDTRSFTCRKATAQRRQTTAKRRWEESELRVRAARESERPGRVCSLKI